VEQAHALEAEGIVDVMIANAYGLQHAPAEFERLYVANAT
jgi:hypothetical protein